MKKAAFTPAPWGVNPINAQIDCAVISKKGGLLPVCKLLWPTDERSEAETDANARLIAAAPDLYDAVLTLIARLDYIGDEDLSVTIPAQSALAKARGE